MSCTLSISIVNTNNKPLLRECLKSLYGQEQGISFETILVDNASTDGSSEMVRAEFPQVQVMQNTARKGFAANHNQGIRAGRGKFILVLNEDTIVKPGALAAICDYLEKHPQTGAVGCRLENPDGTLQPSCYKFPSPWRALAENFLLVAAFPNARMFGDYRSWPHDAVRDVEFVSGAAITVRREVIETTGYLDEGFLIYAEETDWCYRMRKDGWKVTFVPSATIVHYGGQSSINIKDRQFCEFNRSALRYIRKHYGWWGALIQRLSMIVGALLRLPLWSAIYVVNRKESAREKVKLWARLLKLWLGLGPHEGIREAAQKNSGAPSPIT
ncbi:MAG: glycosyltransferase family 2 protein [Tepidisphaeraceae bacterium]